ncbi:MAG: hypothetical protein M0C28_48400 [Candidatus Moduliflexus flocculans]|nr:hypothetical protein [Candidatus Moduliflexus flocculans]
MVRWGHRRRVQSAGVSRVHHRAAVERGENRRSSASVEDSPAPRPAAQKVRNVDVAQGSRVTAAKEAGTWIPLIGAA